MVKSADRTRTVPGSPLGPHQHAVTRFFQWLQQNPAPCEDGRGSRITRRQPVCGDVVAHIGTAPTQLLPDRQRPVVMAPRQEWPAVEGENAAAVPFHARTVISGQCGGRAPAGIEEIVHVDDAVRRAAPAQLMRVHLQAAALA